MRSIFLCFFTVLLTYTAFVYSEQKIFENINIYKISNSTTVEIELEQLIDNLNTSSVIYIGEIHDKPVHHLIQLEIIKKIHMQNKYVAVGMEMFQAKFQKYLDQYISGRISEKELLNKTEYKKRWGHDYELYKPIIEFAKQNHIPIIALNIESEVIKNISKNSISNLDAYDLNKLPGHIDFTNKDYKKFLYDIFKQHPNYKERSFEIFHSIQLVWDEYMAERVDNFIKYNPGYQIIVLAGNGHLVYSHGIPSRVFKRNKTKYSVITNDVEINKKIADYVIQSNIK